MAQDLEPLQRFDQAMCGAPDHTGCTVRELVHRLVELRKHEPQLNAAQTEMLPAYAHWQRWGELVRRLSATLEEVSGVQTLAQHPLRWAGAGIVHAERPLETLNDLAERAESLLDELEGSLARAGLADEISGTLETLQGAVQFARQLARLQIAEELALLDAGSAAARELMALVADLEKRERALTQQREKTRFWRDKLALSDVQAAQAEADALERSWLRIVSPTWRRLKRVMHARYDFSQHAVAPRITHVLAELAQEYAAQAACEQTREQSKTRFRTDEPAQLAAALTSLQAPADRVGAIVREHLLSRMAGRKPLEHLLAIGTRLDQLLPVLDALLADFTVHHIASLGEAVRDLREESDCLTDVLPMLTELDQAPGELRHALRRLPLTAAPLEAAMARKSLEAVYRQQRWLPRFDGRALASRSARIAEAEKQWLAQNASTVRAQVRQRFRANVQLSTLTVSQLDADGRAFKKIYSAGRRELEHEFGKSMRYKSIRELVSGDSGWVVRDLKPIWLMSPLSVSDTLPLDPDLFDVVIFDEASQIPVEEAVPALYRAPQVIVVGDEMQLPPTNFFAAAHDTEDDLLEVEEDGERMAIALDADSLLAQSAKNLPATVLQWHYRSRSESLIGFSNAAFYAGELYTIPDRTLPVPERPEIEVREAQDGKANADALLARPISFHHLQQGLYDQRRNTREAAYIAELVRELLRRETGLSFGIVAFSEAQQSEIESAVESLAAEDAAFAAQLEAEYVREEEDQFCGLFVKNLENVQGDERDVIILSICYGPGPDGRMLMNFGPINQRGGEKRLNVIFSRARHHMAVVSSIRHPAITNDYNDGAAALKNFLRYAECMSRGDVATGRAVLANLNPLTRKTLAGEPPRDVVVTQIAAALRERGHVVDEQVGQSRFRCDLAVRDASGQCYAAGILVDTAAHYANRDIEERCVTRPQILSAFGWRVTIVLSRDWYHEPDATIERIERKLRDEPEALDTIDVESSEVVPLPAVSPAPSIPVEPEPSEGTKPPRTVRRLERKDDHSDKFWEISANESLITIRWGRRGSQGQTQTRQFPTAERAQAELEKLIGEKLRKGYEEVEPM
jgi:predicted DNA-binding WGR domain protein